MPEQDIIDEYLDKVCKNVFFAPTEESMRMGMRKSLGIEPPDDDLLSHYPESFKTAFEVSRSEASALRSELRTHLEASIARIELGDVPHDEAVRQAIAEFGAPSRINRLLKREHKGTVQERISSVLSERDRRKRKAKQWLMALPSSVGGCVVVASISRHGPQSETAWCTVVLFVGIMFPGILQPLLSRRLGAGDAAALATIESMRAMYDRPLVAGATRRQRFWAWVMRSWTALFANRRTFSGKRFAKSLCIRIAVLSGLWLITRNAIVSGCDTAFDYRLYPLNFYLLFTGRWLGETLVQLWDARRTAS